jgi:hypothetical protein
MEVGQTLSPRSGRKSSHAHNFRVRVAGAAQFSGTGNRTLLVLRFRVALGTGGEVGVLQYSEH